MSAPVPYLISRLFDPIFAISIGVAAAGVRINREEKELGRTTQDSIESLKRRWRLVWAGDESGKPEAEGKKEG